MNSNGTRLAYEIVVILPDKELNKCRLYKKYNPE
jgi:hypothetical protein